MPNEQLISYIRENSSKFPKQTLTQALMAQGWAVGDIAAAFSYVEREQAGTSAEVSVSVDPDATFLAEMEKRRQESKGPLPQTIVEGNTEIHPFASASKYLDHEKKSRAEEKGIIGMLIRAKVVKDESQANIVMIGFVVVVIVIIAWLNWPAAAPAVPKGTSGLTSPVNIAPGTSGSPTTPSASGTSGPGPLTP